MTRNPSITQLSIMKELQALINKGSDRGDLPGGVILSFAGPISESSSKAIVTLTENAVTQCGSPRAEILRAKSVVAESLNNILNHGWIDDKGETLLYTILECSENGLILNCGCFIDDDLSSQFEAKINEVNSWSVSGLRKRSVELLCKTEKLDGDQPGLSMINIALNCKRPINYKVTKKEGGINLFSVSMTVNHAIC